MLSDIAQKFFDMQTADTGLMMTVYAWTSANMSLPSHATGNLERKACLIKLFILFIVGHILSVIAWNF